MKLESVYIQSQWVQDLRPLLERTLEHTDKNIVSTASLILGKFRIGDRYFSQGNPYQLTFMVKELKLLSSLTETMGMEEANRKFSIGIK